MKKRKHYLSDFSVNLCTSNWMLISADQLTSGGEMRQEDRQIADNSHIYLVCRRPSLRYDPNNFHYSGGRAVGELVYSVGGKERRISFDTKFPLLDGATGVALSPYPHRELRTFAADNSVVRYLPASALSFREGQHLACPDLADLEVLYVGQSFASGSRSAFERLQSHSTLQKILAEASYENPDCEVLIATFVYEPYRILTVFDGRAKEAISDKRDTGRFHSIVDKPLKKSQQISLAEAALIRYFGPRYNKVYKNNFPSVRQKVLRSCYDLDFSGLVVEIDTEELGFRLFSEAREAAMHHICNIELLSHSDRAGFFFFTDTDGSLKKVAPTIG